MRVRKHASRSRESQQKVGKKVKVVVKCGAHRHPPPHPVESMEKKMSEEMSIYKFYGPYVKLIGPMFKC